MTEPWSFVGVAVGLVTNTKDPDGLGRVKLKLPWLSEDLETDWARVAVPMAGPGTGAMFQPRVDDEALVAFEHGDPALPFVVGWLWNGKDKPPETNDGKSNVQVLRSRSGNMVRLDDTPGKEMLELRAKGDKTTVVLDVAKKTITVTGEQDVVIEAAGGKLTLRGKGGVEIVSQADVKITAQTDLVAKGAKAEVAGSGTLTLKGGTVNIN